MKRITLCLTGLVMGLSMMTHAAVLANFDFENHTAGTVINNVGEYRVDNETKGDGPAFTNNSAALNYTVSTLASGTLRPLTRYSCNVRQDTLANTMPSGGQYLELNPFSVGTASGEMTPDDPAPITLIL